MTTRTLPPSLRATIGDAGAGPGRPCFALTVRGKASALFAGSPSRSGGAPTRRRSRSRGNVNAAHHVTLEGKSYRPRQRPDAKERAAGVSTGDVSENEAVRSPTTHTTERTSITTPVAKVVKTKTN